MWFRNTFLVCTTAQSSKVLACQLSLCLWLFVLTAHSLPTAGLDATFLSNAPCGVYKYKLPKAARTDTSIGTKVFFFKAILSHSDAFAAQHCPVMWLKKSELQGFLKPAYMLTVDRFILDLWTRNRLRSQKKTMDYLCVVLCHWESIRHVLYSMFHSKNKHFFSHCLCFITVHFKMCSAWLLVPRPGDAAPDHSHIL